MNKDRIWLSSPHMGGREQEYIKEAFDANWIAPFGPHIEAFESQLEQYLVSGSVAALNSGTSAIHLGLILLGVGVGDRVICQSLTFAASVNPILYLGAAAVFIDSELETWNLCPIALEAAIVDQIKTQKKPKAIIAVHLYGVPYQVEAIRAIADRYGIPLLEDSAEALGSRYKGQACGSFGDVGVLSFNGNKIITTSSGGALVCSTKELKERAVFLATQAKEKSPHYQHNEVGYNYRMSNICAAIGRGQMEVLGGHVDLRRKMHAFYVDLFKDIEAVTVFSVPSEDYFANYWLTAILVAPDAEKGIDREALRLAFEAANIESRPFWKPMHLQPVFEHFPYYGNQVAEGLFEEGLCLPSGSNLTDEERDRIVATVKVFFGQ